MYPISETNVIKSHDKVEKKGQGKERRKRKREEKGKGKGKGKKKRRNIFAKSKQNKSWKFSAIISVMLLL